MCRCGRLSHHLLRRGTVWNVDLDGMIGSVSMVEPSPNGYAELSITIEVVG
jgi:hypothetical protein